MLGRIVSYTVKEKDGYKYLDIHLEMRFSEIQGESVNDTSMLSFIRSRVGNMLGVELTTLQEQEQTSLEDHEQ